MTFFVLLYVCRAISLNYIFLSPLQTWLSWFWAMGGQTSDKSQGERIGPGYFFSIPLHLLLVLILTVAAYIPNSPGRNSFLHCSISYEVRKCYFLHLQTWGRDVWQLPTTPIALFFASFKTAHTSERNPFIVFYWTLGVRFYFLLGSWLI